MLQQKKSQKGNWELKKHLERHPLKPGGQLQQKKSQKGNWEMNSALFTKSHPLTMSYNKRNPKKGIEIYKRPRQSKALSRHVTTKEIPKRELRVKYFNELGNSGAIFFELQQKKSQKGNWETNASSKSLAFKNCICYNKRNPKKGIEGC